MLFLTPVIKSEVCAAVHIWANFNLVDRYDNKSALKPMPWYLQAVQIIWDPGCLGNGMDMKFVLLYLQCCCYCDWACTVIELLELAIIIELVRLSLLGYASTYRNYICGCNVDITSVGLGVVICDDFSSEWFAHWLLLGLVVGTVLDLSFWASPGPHLCTSWDFHTSFLSFY